MKYNLDNLPWRDIGDGWQDAKVELKEGDSAVNPASTSRLLYGPAVVTYQRGPSGAISTHVADPSDA